MPDLLAPLLSRFTRFAMTTDGIPEINSLAYMGFESGYEETPPTERVALVLVESRLVGPTGNPLYRTELERCLQRLKGDLRAEGLYTRFIVADLYRGSVHKDGRIVLALRQFFREVKAAFTGFEGAILVGNFPEASLVRRVSWCVGWLPRGVGLVIGPEMVSERAEIVLADLTGNWERIYNQNDFTTEEIHAYADEATTARGWRDGEMVRTCEFTSTDFIVRRSSVTYRDAFCIDDAIYTIVENRTTPSPFLRLRINSAERNAEVDAADRSMVNIIARPDISVSRINAFHVAVNPNPSLRGTDGRTFLDAAGNPQTVTSSASLFNADAQATELFTFKDIDLERRLLIGYVNRNHRFRNGAFSNLPFRGAIISGTTDFHPDYYEGLVNAAATDFEPCVKKPNANLLEYVQFHKTPAVLKYIMAHSDARYSDFNAGYDLAALTAEAGGPPARWSYVAGRYIPGFEMGGAADLFVHRALWQNNALRLAGASLVIHGGCNVNSVDESQSVTYVAPNYAHWNNAEGVLFYTNCVALFSRAKGFNDSPNGFTEGYRLSDRANFGSCWKSYFNAQANDGSISAYNIQRKRAYFWSINGDWTLRLRNKNGLGILSFDGGLRSTEVHPNRAWIDGWNYDGALNRIRGIGDVDGDGTDEFIVTSDWGIGILKYNGIHFRALMTAARDTWFGGWRYDATINPVRDKIYGVENFTGTPKSEAMVWSSWGLATLEFNGTSLLPSRIHANGTRLGGWIINTNDNLYCGAGQFDADGRKDMVVTSPRGIGIVSLQNSTHIYMAPNGTRFGGWLYNSADNMIRIVGDFDGDGFDEILISSPWGIAILKMQSGALTAVAMHANGDNLSGYVVNNFHGFTVADNFKGGAAKQILVTDTGGIHMLTLVGSRLVRQAFAANGARIDGWIVDTASNRVQSAGDLNGDGKAEFIIWSPWGIGVMGIDAANNFRGYSLVAHNTVLNDWYLQSGDAIAGAGNITGGADRKELLIMKV